MTIRPADETPEQLDELASEYVLGTLSDERRRSVQQRLPDDAELRTLSRPEQGFKRLELPAADPQRKALHNKAEQTQRAGCKQDDGKLPARLRQPEQPGR